MRLSSLGQDVENKTGIKKVFLSLLLVSIATNLLLGAAVLTADRTHRETLIPPDVSKTFWVEGKRASASYLEQMGQFVIGLALNATPASADYNAQQILKYATPQAYGTLEAELGSNALHMKEVNVSTYFSPQSVRVNEAKQSVLFQGNLSSLIGDKVVNTASKQYIVRFKMQGGTIYLTELRDVPTSVKNPFDEAQVEKSDTAKLATKGDSN